MDPEIAEEDGSYYWLRCVRVGNGCCTIFLSEMKFAYKCCKIIFCYFLFIILLKKRLVGNQNTVIICGGYITFWCSGGLMVLA